MENNIDISVKGGYIIDKGIFITPEEANKLPNDKVCLLCTGTQGEPLAALSRIADGVHKQIKLQPDDVVIFSSSAIPGNGAHIGRTINKLYLKGVKVYTNTSLNDVHASGHGNEEELKWMLRIINPKYFAPFHGEYRMLKKHTDIGVMCGIPRENTFVLSNGEVLSLYKGKVSKAGFVEADDIYVDGNRIGDLSNAVIRERKLMANDGIIIVVANVKKKKKKLLGNPNITTRGFVLVNENEVLLKSLEEVASEAITGMLDKPINYADIKAEIINKLADYTIKKTGRKPIILPVIMDIKRS